jgi:hypothetical protein
MIRVNPINILLFVQILQRKQFEEDFNLANNISQLAWMADADGRYFGIINAGLITPAHHCMKGGVGRKFTIQTIYNEW